MEITSHGRPQSELFTNMGLQFGSLTQGWASKQDISGGEQRYEAVTCPACTRLHFIDRKAGKTLGQDK